MSTMAMELRMPFLPLTKYSRCPYTRWSRDFSREQAQYLTVDLDVERITGINDSITRLGMLVLKAIITNEILYSVNIPLRAGATDTTFIKVFQAIFPTAVKMFRPEVFVLQVTHYQYLGTKNL